MTEDGRPYIRPCAAFPDGYFLPPGAVDELLQRELIEENNWSEYAGPNDYEAIYDDDDMDQVVYDIVGTVRRWTAPGAFR